MQIYIMCMPILKILCSNTVYRVKAIFLLFLSEMENNKNYHTCGAATSKIIRIIQIIALHNGTEKKSCFLKVFKEPGKTCIYGKPNIFKKTR